MLRLLAHTAVIVAWCFAFSFVMFLGLQVSPAYGYIGLGVLGIVGAVYVYLGFLRR